jgi:hypothetical protein
MLTLCCVLRYKPFDFAVGESAVILRHIAYGYGFVHAQHESSALDWIFVDPDYDRPEFSHDSKRVRVLDVARPAAGPWSCRDSVDNTAPSEHSDPTCSAGWEALVRARYRGEQTLTSRPLAAAALRPAHRLCGPNWPGRGPLP